MSKKVLMLGDIHFPFEDEGALEKAHLFARENQPDLIIQVGDLFDLFAFSKYPRSLNLMTPVHELRMAEDKARAMWARFSKDCKKAKKVQLKGNHDSRAEKRALESLASAESFVAREVNRMMTFHGVQTVHDEKDEYINDGVLYQHGYRKFGDHAKYNQMNTACGHLHRAGLIIYQNIHGSFWELNVGWLGDKRCPVFSYRCQNKISGTSIGIGWKDELGPRFIPFE
jgi:predicted phosphodiesterase